MWRSPETGVGIRARVIGSIAAPLAAAMVLAACGSSAGAAPQSSLSSPPVSAVSGTGPPSSPARHTAARSGAVISSAEGADGTYLVGADGRSVYLWVADTSSMSTCTGACAAVWPPVTTTAAPTASGAAVASKLGTTKRTDGSEQVTYGGHPLYYFASDSGPGQTTGQGNGGFGAKWWLLTPSGSAITTG